MAKVIARDEREAAAETAPASHEPLLLLVALGGLAIGTGGVLTSRLSQTSTTST
jgi:hypothetical protein